ncbi:hypothetical protein BpHYR1_000866 [Brachionus plicatilis]|uniref:Uncharacterized protein n=1 Tax=Brachionus plicatilis TaxID=10195 RepID=A0A3M7S366_BRAPC|nr:hypothetical protein BpHYR1_000866 [Brachionus plicatilis]
MFLVILVVVEVIALLFFKQNIYAKIARTKFFAKDNVKTHLFCFAFNPFLNFKFILFLSLLRLALNVRNYRQTNDRESVSFFYKFEGSFLNEKKKGFDNFDREQKIYVQKS